MPTGSSRKGRGKQSWKQNIHTHFISAALPPTGIPVSEAAAIKTSKKLGIELVPLKGASCCPAPGAFGSIDLNVLYAMAARNLVLAEQMKTDIALLCNGCYKSIWEVNHKLKHNDELRDGVNEVLKDDRHGIQRLDQCLSPRRTPV